MHHGLLTAGNDRYEPPLASPRRPFRRVLVLAVTLVIVAAATVSAMQLYSGPGPAAAPAPGPAARVDPGLADVTATLGYQQAISGGTGMVLTPSGRVITNNHVIEGAVFAVGDGCLPPSRHGRPALG